MRVLFLGTSGSTFDRGNMPPSILIDQDLLFDCPAPCPYELSRRNVPVEKLTVFLTHLHADHSLGLLDLAWHLWISQKGPIDVYVPRGAEGELEKLVASLHREKAGQLLGAFNVTPVEPGDLIGEVEVVEASHPVPAVGYVVRRGGRSLCYTGDTSPLPTHVEAFRGCGLLVHEATYPPGMEEEAVADGHSTPVQAARTALAAGVDRLALVHIPTARLGWSVREEYVAAAAKIFSRVSAPLGGEKYIL